jgi:hypothetical protein
VIHSSSGPISKHERPDIDQSMVDEESWKTEISTADHLTISFIGRPIPVLATKFGYDNPNSVDGCTGMLGY